MNNIRDLPVSPGSLRTGTASRPYLTFATGTTAQAKKGRR